MAYLIRELSMARLTPIVNNVGGESRLLVSCVIGTNRFLQNRRIEGETPPQIQIKFH